MRVNKKQFNKVFKDMKVDAPKVWAVTVPKLVHKDKKKEMNKKACRGRIA